MKRIIMVSIAAMFWALLLGPTSAIANGESSGCSGYKGKLLNACAPGHNHKSPRGVGADILIHETEAADFVAEYKYDGENEEHSIFAVVKTKKSLVDYAKDIINKVKDKVNE